MIGYSKCGARDIDTSMDFRKFVQMLEDTGLFSNAWKLTPGTTRVDAKGFNMHMPGASGGAMPTTTGATAPPPAGMPGLGKRMKKMPKK